MSVTFLKPCQKSLNMAVSAALLGCERRLWQLSLFSDWFSSSGQTNIGGKACGMVKQSRRLTVMFDRMRRFSLKCRSIVSIMTAVVTHMMTLQTDRLTDVMCFWLISLQVLQTKTFFVVPWVVEKLGYYFENNCIHQTSMWYFTLRQYKVASFIFSL